MAVLVLGADKDANSDEERFFFLAERYMASAALAVDGEREAHSTGEMLTAEEADEERTAMERERCMTMGAGGEEEDCEARLCEFTPLVDQKAELFSEQLGLGWLCNNEGQLDKGRAGVRGSCACCCACG